MQPTELSFVVQEDDTAAALGSGDLEVLATPRLLAWFEAATVAALDLPQERTSVGSRVCIEHLAATPGGGRITVGAALEHQDGRLLRFSLTALDGTGKLVGTGEVTRVVVDRDRFLARLGEGRQEGVR